MDVLTESYNNSNTPALPKNTVHQHTLPLGHPPLYHITHGLEH